jgi:hypothetical protein
VGEEDLVNSLHDNLINEQSMCQGDNRSESLSNLLTSKILSSPFSLDQ